MPQIDSIDALRQAKEALQEAINQKKLTADLLKNLGPAVIDALRPTLEALSQNTKLSKEELLQAISQIKIDVPKVDVPQAQVEVKIPEIIVPEPKVTVNISDIKIPEIPPIKIPPIKVPKPEVTVNVPPFKIPRLEWPADKMPIEGWVRLMGYDYKNPVPVQLWDGKGNPVTLFENLTQLISSGGGGAAKIVKVSGFGASAFAEITNPDGRVKVELPTGSSGLTDTELRAASVDVQQASGAIWSVSVNDAFRTTVASALINSDNRLRVSVETGGSGLTDAELRAAHLDVQQVSGSIDSVWVKGFDGSVAAALVDSSGVGYSGSNPLPVSATVTLDQAQDEGEADGRTLRTVHAGDVGQSTNVYQIGGNAVVVGGGWKDNALRVVEAQDSIVSVNVMQMLGNATVVGSGYQDNALRVVHATDAIVSVRVDSSSATTAASLIDSSGVQYSGSNPLPVTGTVAVSGVTASVQATIIDSTGVGYSGSNPIPITGSVSLSGALSSAVAVGPTPADTADDGNAPIQIGGIARQNNPTAVAANDVVKATFDDVGRQLIRPVQVRDLIATAYVSLTNGTETTLLAGVAGSYLDLIYVMGANNSDVAVSVDIRAVTAGNIQTTIRIPANGTAGVSLPVPIPQDETGNNWTADLPDITGTTITLSALFSKEI